MAPKIPEVTPLTDRQLIVHILEHVEELSDQVAELHAAAAPFLPLLAAPGGRPDSIALLQAGREARRGRSRSKT